MGRQSRALALAVMVALVAPGGPAAAGEWELEAYGGGLFTLTPTSGRATTLPPWEPFPTVLPGISSRRVVSWYFGDGGRLIRQQRSSPTSIGPYTTQRQVMVGTLDSVLSSAAVRQPFGGVVGLRLGRRLGRRLTAELDIEYGPRAPTFSEASRADIEESRLAFETAWSDVLAAVAASDVTSRASLLEGSGHQIVATGVLNVNLTTGDAPEWSRRPPRRRFVTYLTFGAGITSSQGVEASATLVGRYRFASPARDPGAIFEEADTVTVRSSSTFGTSFVGVVGLGWKQDLSTRWGIRFDARAYLSRNPGRIVIDARPSLTNGDPTSVVVLNSGIGAIQFVNSPSGDQEGHRSSLSGPALAGFETFEGTGMLAQINVTFGVFLRF